MKILIKRAYDGPDEKDGFRVLVDRLWPRGLSKDKLKIDAWYKDVAPSTGLRQWFGHDPERWAEFQKRYKGELASSAVQQRLRDLLQEAGRRNITLVYSAQDAEHNQAVVLRDVLAKLAG
ncbi:MAG: DUF488 domain-containing protein [Acidobacteriaceae bacterium]